MSRSQDIEVFVFLAIQLSTLRRHNEYHYMRQGAFLKISFEPYSLQFQALDQNYVRHVCHAPHAYLTKFHFDST